MSAQSSVTSDTQAPTSYALAENWAYRKKLLLLRYSRVAGPKSELLSPMYFSRRSML